MEFSIGGKINAVARENTQGQSCCSLFHAECNANPFGDYRFLNHPDSAILCVVQAMTSLLKRKDEEDPRGLQQAAVRRLVAAGGGHAELHNF